MFSSGTSSLCSNVLKYNIGLYTKGFNKKNFKNKNNAVFSFTQPQFDYRINNSLYNVKLELKKTDIILIAANYSLAHFSFRNNSNVLYNY